MARKAEKMPAAAAAPPPLAAVLAVNVAVDREARGWTQEQLAVYAGLTRNTVNTIERARDVNDPSSRTRTIEALAEALGEPWTELLAVRAPLASLYAAATRVYLHRRLAGLRGIEGDRRGAGQAQIPLVAPVRPPPG